MREWKEVAFQNWGENNDNANVYTPLQYADNSLSIFYIIILNFSIVLPGGNEWPYFANEKVEGHRA